MEFRLLGPVELSIEGRQHKLGPGRERQILAMLLWRAGRPISLDTLIDRLWEGSPPPRARDDLYAYLTRLRSSLRRAGCGDAALIRKESAGYVMHVDRERVDVHVFRETGTQAGAAAEAGDDVLASALYRDAEALWRGEPLAGLTGTWASHVRSVLETEHLESVVARADVEMRLGRHAELIGELHDLSGSNPLNEAVAARLMLALYGCGRPAEALAVFRRVRERFREEMGDDPGAELQAIHLQILGRDPALTIPVRQTHPHAAERIAVTNNLPRDISDFVGREAEIAQLIEDAAGDDDDGASGHLKAVSGLGGMGKTTLVVHVAHLLASEYPDGQYYLNLQAHHVAQEPLSVEAALESLLTFIGIPASDLPRSAQERAALWRAQMATRRAVIVLDDAAGADQVRELLPGATRSLVLVASRHKLSGLEGARSLPLGPLLTHEALALFHRLVDGWRDRDATAITKVFQACGNLPMAVRMVAAKVRQRGALDIEYLAARLAPHRGRLKEIRTTDLDIGPIFDLSYRGLDTRAQRVFRLLGLHPTPSLSAEAIAALGGRPLGETERQLDSLIDCHLVEERLSGRYVLHDLVHSYAVDLVDREEDQGERRATQHRLLDFYLSTADRADRLAFPRHRRLAATVTYTPSDPVVFRDADEARTWLDLERENLLAIATHAADGSWTLHATMLAHILANYLEAVGAWDSGMRLHERAVGLWRVTGNVTGLASALRDLSTLYGRTGRYEEAMSCTNEVLTLLDESGEDAAHSLDHLGQVHWKRGEYHLALHKYEVALKTYAATGNREGVADMLDNSAIVHADMGDYPAALKHFRKALVVYREIGDQWGELVTSNNLGFLYGRLGHDGLASKMYRQAVELNRTVKNRQMQATLLTNLATISRRAGRLEEAVAGYREALSIQAEISDLENEGDSLSQLAEAYLDAGNLGEAIRCAHGALSIARQIGQPHLQIQSMRGAATIYHRASRSQAALTLLRRALELVQRFPDRYEEGRICEMLGNVLKDIRGVESARVYWEQALSLYAMLSVPEEKALRNRLNVEE